MAMTPKEMIEVLQHFGAGGDVESKGDDGIWRWTAAPVWDFLSYDYRIKPKPLELWAVVKDVDDVLGVFNNNTSAHAFRDGAATGRVIKVREVLGD
jgi:hypothetical protein